VHLVGFTMRMYHDARSAECQILQKCYYTAIHDVLQSTGLLYASITLTPIHTLYLSMYVLYVQFTLLIRNISVGTLTRLEVAPPSKRCSIPGKDNRFLSYLQVHTRPWGPPGYSMSTGALSPCLKRPGRQADPSPPSSAEMRNQWSCTFISPYAIITYTKRQLFNSH
jgi:hypothetical protein